MSFHFPVARREGPGSSAQTSATGDDRAFGPLGKQDLVRLAEIGFEAVEQGRGAGARPIFELLERAQPENAAASIGLALTDYAEGAATAAIDRLKRATRGCALSVDEAKATLAVLLAMEGRRTEAAELRRELLRRPDSASRRMVLGLQVGTTKR